MTAKFDEGKPGAYAEVLEYLKKNDTGYSNSREIAESLNVSRQVIYDAVAYLRDCGYVIGASRHEGYSLRESPDKLVPVGIAAGLRCRQFANRIYTYDEVGSTNASALEMAKSGQPAGTLVVADSQFQGRGRMGRKWHSPRGKGLYFSLILRPDLPIDRISGLSLVAGLGIIRALKETADCQFQIKWPNDILFRKKKLAGILVEMSAELDRVQFMIVGIGINVNQNRKDFPLGLQRKATSLKIACGKTVSRLLLLQEILTQFESLYINFCRHGFEFLASELIEHSAIIGKNITLRIGSKKITGKAVGFDDCGRLLVKNKRGLMSYPAGEVTFR